MVTGDDNNLMRKIGATLFLMIFVLAGIAGVGFLGYMFYQETATHSWVETPCRIESGEIIKPQDAAHKYSYKVEYSYAYNGRNYSAARLSSSFQEPEIEYKDVLKLSRDYPRGNNAKCYVNPSNPSNAVLIRGNSWKLLLWMFIPLAFVAVGLRGIYITWHTPKLTDIDYAAAPTAKMINYAQYFVLFFGGILLLSGIICGYFTFLSPAWKIWNSADWSQTPCEVESSRFTSSSSGEGTTYDIELIYHYQYKGITYIGDRYDFMNSNITRPDDWLVRNYFPGKKTFCYVNPANPDEAVLSRDVSLDLWIGVIATTAILWLACWMIGLSRKLDGRIKQQLQRSTEENICLRN